MTIEDRVRRVLTDAVTNEPPLNGAPLDRALARRRPRLAFAGAAALLLVPALVVAVAVVRDSDRPTITPAATTSASTTTVATAGWPALADRTGNLRLRHPPGWKVRPGPLGNELVPPVYAGSRPGRAKYAVTVAVFPGFYLSGYDWRGATRGRLPGGQPYAKVSYPDLAPGGDIPPSSMSRRC